MESSKNQLSKISQFYHIIDGSVANVTTFVVKNKSLKQSFFVFLVSAFDPYNNADTRDVLFEFHLKFWNTASIGIQVRSLL